MLVEGGFYIGQPNPTPETWFLGLSALGFGVLLLIGFLTPVAGIVMVMGGAAVALSLFPACTPNLFDSKPALIFALTMLVTIIGAGPGRFSLDARVFGRREIIIPPPLSQSQR